jgi:serine/threonine-protein kinase
MDQVGEESSGAGRTRPDDAGNNEATQTFVGREQVSPSPDSPHPPTERVAREQRTGTIRSGPGVPAISPARQGGLKWSVPGYTEVRTLGSGGFGEVKLARHDASGTQVAIKYLRGNLLADPEFAALFRAEAAVLASLDDQNVVRLYEYVESPAGAAIVMELVDGVSLRDILARQGTTTAEAALVVLQGSLLGLAAAHRHGVVHRDYKPENVLIDGTGASKLTDFGIAARAGDSPIPAGTLAYAPPEQFNGSPASPATDVYAATATFYECLTGRPPFDGDTAEALLRQHQTEPVPLEPVPEPLRPLVAAGLAKDPGRRPADGAALVAELRAVAGGAYGPDWENRGRSALAAAALLLAALWPAAGGAAAAQASRSLYRVRLRRRTPHGHVSVAKAAVTAGVVVAGVAVAAGVILAGRTGHPAPVPTPTSARAPAPASAPAPAQLTGTQLAAALLPVADFPAGYSDLAGVVDNGPDLTHYPDTVSLTKASCTLGQSPIFWPAASAFNYNLGFGATAQADNSFKNYNGVVIAYLSEAIYQFASPAQAGAFLSAARTCLTDEQTWASGMDTAPVNGDQAVTANLRAPVNFTGESIGRALFVQHGTDVFALGASSNQNLSVMTIPRADELIAKLIARAGALRPASSAGSGSPAAPAPSAVSSPAADSSPAGPARQQAARALAALLAQNGTDRAVVTQAVSAVAACSSGLSQDETIFSNAASSHQVLLGKLAALPDRSALPAPMLADLTTAWQASGQADQDFARWTQDEIAHGCSTSYQSDAGYQAARAPDDQATTEKKAFAALWTAIADQYGLPLYQYNQI